MKSETAVSRAYLDRALETIKNVVEGRDGSGEVTEERLLAAVERARLVHELEEEELEQLFAEALRHYSVYVGETTVLEDKKDHEPWLTGEAKENRVYWDRYFRLLAQDLPREALRALDQDTDRTLSLLESPERPGPWDRRGLVVGHVQSGKTTHYAGLINKAADAGYKIIIVLAGLHNNLRAQTQARLEEAFIGHSTAGSVDGGKRHPIGVGKFADSDFIAPNALTTRAEDGDFKKATANAVAITPEKIPWLFVIKKNVSVLKSLYEWLDLNIAKRGRIEDLPLLLIDDESDHGSIDTNRRNPDFADGMFDPEHDPTRTNGYIRRILQLFSKKAYVAYTATPFANIFIHRDASSQDFGDDLFPRSFIVNLAAPSNYFGPAQVFGAQGTGTDAMSDMIEVVDDYLGSNPSEGWMPPRHRKTHRPMVNEEAKLPDSVEEAIHTFILSCAVRKARGDGQKHASMLLHVTRFVDVQEQVYSQVSETIEHLQDLIRFESDSLDPLAAFRALYEAKYRPQGERLIQTLDRKAADYYWPVWDDLVAHVRHIIRDVDVRLINGGASDVLDYELHRSTGLKTIIIGGDKLSRGLTLEGLTVSYFLRAARAYDTLMQMGRWFGYREDYIDLCRLFSSSDLLDGFAHITKAATDLRVEFDRMSERRETPEKYGLKVEVHPSLLITSRNKMRDTQTVRMDLFGHVLETTRLPHSLDATRRNLEALGVLVDSMGERDIAYSPPWRLKDTGVFENTLVWRNVSSEHVRDFFASYVTSQRVRYVHSQIIHDFIAKRNFHGELTEWTVVIRGGDGGSRDIETLGGQMISLPLVQRTIQAADDESVVVQRVGGSQDEWFDGTPKQYREALRKTNDALKGQNKEAQYPNGRLARDARGQSEGRAVDLRRGLLVLYAIAPKYKDEPIPQTVLDSPPIGVLLSFPTAPDIRSEEFRVNSVMKDWVIGDHLD